jgi:hypothetical protein
VRYARGAVAIWDVSDPMQPQLVRARAEDATLELTTPNFSPDGRNLLLSDGRTLWLGDTRTLDQKLKVTRSSWNHLSSAWSSDGKRLIYGAKDENSPNWTIRVIDPDAPEPPLVELAHRTDYVRKFEDSFDAQTLVVNRTVKELPSGRTLASFDERWWVDSVLPGKRMILSNNWWPFAQLVDLASGDVLATLPESRGYALLGDGKTLLTQPWMGRVQFIRNFGSGLQRPAILSPRFWLMLPPALLLALSLCRDASRRSRIKPGKFDALAGVSMIFAGVACLAWGLAQTAVERSFGVHTWWSAHWTLYPALACLCCGMGVLAGSNAWLWMTRLTMLLVIALALGSAAYIPTPKMGLIALDLLWIAPAWIPRAWCFACAALAVVFLASIGRSRCARVDADPADPEYGADGRANQF